MQLDRHAIIGISIPTNKNAPIITGTLHVKERLICFVWPARVYCYGVIPACGRKPHLETQFTVVQFSRTRYVSGIREYFNKLFVGFCLQAINDKQYHARDLLGALLYRRLAPPTEHFFDSLTRLCRAQSALKRRLHGEAAWIANNIAKLPELLRKP